MAAHVQADTIPDAIRPGLTLRDALQNSSEFFGEYAVYRAWIAVRHIINALKNRPIPVRMVDFQDRIIDLRGQTYRRLTPKHVTDEKNGDIIQDAPTPYPAPCGRTGSLALDIVRIPRWGARDDGGVF